MHSPVVQCVRQTLQYTTLYRTAFIHSFKNPEENKHYTQQL